MSSCVERAHLLILVGILAKIILALNIALVTSNGLVLVWQFQQNNRQVQLSGHLPGHVSIQRHDNIQITCGSLLGGIGYSSLEVISVVVQVSKSY
jgi:hypothetical protein